LRRLLESWNTYILEGQDVKRVVKVIMIRGDDKVLILRRSGKVISEESPWEWDLPGGHVEKDEALDDALDREVWEETSLDLGGATKIYTDDYTTFYVSYEWEGKIMLSQEHDGYKWIKPENVTNYDIGDKYERAIGRIAVK
jgi:8-oxo-dGTP pyrophosphatase MutT (NUDIX family)